MSCKDCGATRTEPCEFIGKGDSIQKAYWIMVEGDQPVHVVGIEEDGDLAFRFAVWPYEDPPEPEPGQEILCPECFDRRYPLEDDGGEDWTPSP